MDAVASRSPPTTPPPRARAPPPQAHTRARGWYGMAEHTRAWHAMVWHVMVPLGSCIQLEEQCNCSANCLCQMVVGVVCATHRFGNFVFFVELERLLHVRPLDVLRSAVGTYNNNSSDQGPTPHECIMVILLQRQGSGRQRDVLRRAV